MIPLSDADILSICSQAGRQQPPERALSLLAAGAPGAEWEELLGLHLGRRDRLLFQLRERTIGQRMTALFACPVCAASNEVNFTARDLGFGSDVREAEAAVGSIRCRTYEVEYRALNSTDLLAIPGDADVEAVRIFLARRTVLSARNRRGRCAADRLPGYVINELSRLLEAVDPLADIRLSLSCVECGHTWTENFDIGEFFWQELCVLAERIVQDVHLLARSYGWSERDILSMPPARRHMYLQMVAA